MHWYIPIQTKKGSKIKEVKSANTNAFIYLLMLGLICNISIIPTGNKLKSQGNNVIKKGVTL